MNREMKYIINQSRRLLLETSLTEKEISKSLYISESYFRKIYNTIFSMPPKKYIKLVKLKKAQGLLKHTNLPINEIAKIVGYQHLNKFTESFKAQFGVSPKKYRDSVQ